MRFSTHVTVMALATRARSAPVLTSTWPNVAFPLSTFTYSELLSTSPSHLMSDTEASYCRTSTCTQAIFRRMLLFEVLAALLSWCCQVCQLNVRTSPYHQGYHLRHEHQLSVRTREWPTYWSRVQQHPFPEASSRGGQRRCSVLPAYPRPCYLGGTSSTPTSCTSHPTWSRTCSRLYRRYRNSNWHWPWPVLTWGT